MSGTTGKLLAASRKEDTNSIRSYVESGGDLMAVKDVNGKTVLHYCSENESTETAEFILESTPKLIDSKDYNGITALHMAAVVGNTAMIEVFLKHKANINLADDDQHTAVHWAIVYSQLDCLSLLISRSALITECDIQRVYPIHYAAQACASAENTAQAADIIKKLVKSGAKVDCTDSLGRIPLHWTVTIESVEGTETLLQLGSDIEARDKTGLTPLHCAASKGNVSMVKLLVTKYSATVDSVDTNNCTPLFYAVTLGHDETVKELINLGADVNTSDKKGRTASHFAAAKNKPKSFEILIKSGADPWMRNAAGDTALHEACYLSNTAMIRSLLSTDEAQSHMNDCNSRGQTPVHLAALKQDSVTLKALVDKGADVNVPLPSEDGTPKLALDLVRSPEVKDFIIKSGGKSALLIISEEDETTADIAPQTNAELNVPVEDGTGEHSEHNKDYNDINSYPDTDKSEKISLSLIADQFSENKKETSDDKTNSDNPSNEEENLADKRSESPLIGPGLNFTVSSDEDETVSSKKTKESDNSISNSEQKESDSTETTSHISQDPKSSITNDIQHSQSSKKSRAGIKKSSTSSTNSSKMSSEKESEIESDRRSKSPRTPSSRGASSNTSRLTDNPQRPKSTTPNLKSRQRSPVKYRPTTPRETMNELNRKSFEISKSIATQVHRSVANYEYIRFTSKAIEEYGRHMIRKSAPTTMGFPIISSTMTKPRKSRPKSKKRKQNPSKSPEKSFPFQKSRSLSSNSIHSSDSKSSNSSNDSSNEDSSENSNQRAVSRMQSKPIKKEKNEKNPPERPSTQARNRRPVTAKSRKLADGAARDRAMRSAYGSSSTSTK